MKRATGSEPDKTTTSVCREKEKGTRLANLASEAPLIKTLPKAG